MPTLEHKLLSPFQCHVNNVVMNDMPEILLLCPKDKDHAIVVHDLDNTTSHLIFTLELDGVVSYLPV